MADQEARPASFTGRARRRTSPLVRWIDRLARWVIAAGGIGTIAMVSLVCIFLVSVVLPLFQGADVDRNAVFSAPEKTRAPIKVGLDEYRTTGWVLYPDGKLYCFRLTDGQALGLPQEIKGAGAGEASRMTAWSFATDSEHCAFGFNDGSVRTGAIGFKTSFLEADGVPESLRRLPIGEVSTYEDGIVSRTPEGQFRLQKLDLSLDPPTPAVTNSPILRIAFAIRSEGPLLCTHSADGSTALHSLTKQTSLLSDDEKVTVETYPVPAVEGKQGPPSYVLVSGLGDNVILVWGDGRLCRFDTRDLSKPRPVEMLNILSGNGETITAVEYLLGGGTLMVGDSAGNVRAWTTSKPRSAPTSDGIVLVGAHEFSLGKAPITALAVSSRDRMVVAGAADGNFSLLYVTSNRVMATARPDGDGPIQSVAIAPRGDGLLAVGPGGVSSWKVDPAYPEISLATLFRPVWYEGYSGPTHSWQSSSGSDAFEPKFGLWPLIFGTLKATTYSMLFGAPLALLAALYTSEFLNPRLRAKIKPTVEVMASLPSVVLGFLAGLVIAPAAESVVPAILTSFFAIPAALLLAAHLWQLLPAEWAVRWRRWRLLAILLVVPLGVLIGVVTGPIWERLLFGGDLKAWLNGHVGSGTPGWFVILLPPSALITAWMMGQYIKPILRRASANWSRFRSGVFELARFLAACATALLVAWLAGLFLNSLSLDPRGILVGTYVQRNALIVGFMMGFAIIPLIYTIADDALSSVPAHLRSASLGCGATNWQTALRIVIPTAMSGLFSALMIGLGRAVGETMIVLMAAGNTPIMDWNIFNGFQTLSATIATEMPEAARDGTHYRTLFLAALTLFVMTFFVNTIAEMIRLRFRRRAHEL
jgi:phosphate transport system permease protein